MQVVPAHAPSADLTKSFGPRTSTRTVRTIVQRHGWAGRLLWLGIVSLHTICAAFYFIVAAVYAIIPMTILSVNLRAFELTIDMKYYPVAVVLHAFYGVMHLGLMLVMVGASVRSGQLIFKLPERKPSERNPFLAWPREVYDMTFGRMGLFGVDNQNFEALFVIREVIEAVLQSIQAYQMSHYVPRAWLNNFWVIGIAVSCISTPVLRKICWNRRRVQLLLILLSDVILDFTSSVGIPAILAGSYLPDYDPVAQDFKEEVWYSDLWYVNMVNEFQLLFIQSWHDFFMRTAFAAGLLLSLDDIKILVSTVEPDARPLGASKRSFLDRSEAIAVRQYLIKILHWLLVCWGIVILGLHIEASYNNDVPGCQLIVRPWLTAKTACSFLLVDCNTTTPPIVGRASELASTWEGASEGNLELITVQNCPALELPPSIQTLERLMGLNIVGSTVVSWPEEAALTATAHPAIRHLGLLYVDFSAFGGGNGNVLPPGLSSPQFPPRLFDIFVLECGWATLPAMLDTSWPPQANLLIPSNGITEIPEVIYRMRPMRIMLDNNPISELPIELLLLRELQSLELVGTPLVSLPELPPGGSFTGSELTHLRLSGSNVSMLPMWMSASTFLSQVYVRADDTPLCARIALNDPDVSPFAGRVSC